MLSMYPACFYKEDDGYSVIFPDLNYLATQGDSFEDAMEMAVECLASYRYIAQRDGEDVPAPSSLVPTRSSPWMLQTEKKKLLSLMVQTIF